MTSAGVVRAEARKATIGVVIVDDHPLFRQGLRQLVESDERFALIAEADSGETAKRLIMQHRPDLAVLDVNLPDITGLDVAEIIRAAGLNTRFVVLTMLKDEQAFNRAMNIGIDGYILKENASTEIINCMLSVAGGNAYVSPSLTGFLLRRRGRAEALASHKPGLDDLTTAERRILKRIAQKKTSRGRSQPNCTSVPARWKLTAPTSAPSSRSRAAIRCCSSRLRIAKH